MEKRTKRHKTQHTPQTQANHAVTAAPIPQQLAPHRQPRRRPALAHHRIKCSVCRHPHLAAIERDYLHWHSPAHLALAYGIPNPSAVDRHAHATGLNARRRRNTINSLEFLIEHAESVVPTANEIINAVRACSLLNNQGVWTDPPRRHVVVHVDEQGNPLPAPEQTPAKPHPTRQSPPVTNVTSAQNAQFQSPTRAIRNWFKSLKTKTTRLIQSPTFPHSAKPKKSQLSPSQQQR